MAAKVVPNVAEFRRCKARVADLYQHMNDAITAKKTVHMHANVLTDLKFLSDEIARLTRHVGGEVSPDVLKVAKFVDRIVEEQAPAIRGGQFVAASAALFRTYRLLVRQLETAIYAVLDPDDALQMKAERTDIKEVNRIELDVADLLETGDDDEPADAKGRKPALAGVD